VSAQLCKFLPDNYVRAANLKEFFSTAEQDKLEANEEREYIPNNVSGKSCNTNLFFGFFFDGTKNNYTLAEKTKEQSNVARLYDTFPGQSVPDVLSKETEWTLDKDENFSNFFRVYVPGVASPFPDVKDSGKGLDQKRGAAMGWKGNDRIIWALIQAINNVHRFFHNRPLISPQETTAIATSLSLSRQARSVMMANLNPSDPDNYEIRFSAPRTKFEEILKKLHVTVEQHWSENGGRPKKKEPSIVQEIFISTFGFSRGATQARAFANWLDSLCRLDAKILGKSGTTLGGFPVSFDFLGLFDTVASIGVGNTFGNAPLLKFADGHGAWADADDSLRIPASVKECVHLMAAHEQRRSFPADSIAVGFTYPPNCEEIVFPGVHSDIGGGYAPMDHGKGVNANGDDMLSRLPLLYMYKAARLAGVPLKLELASSTAQGRFAVQAKVISDLNAYLSKCKLSEGALTDLTREQQILQMRWRYFRRDKGGDDLNKTESYKRSGNFDKNDMNSALLEFNEELTAFKNFLPKLTSADVEKQVPGMHNSVSSEWKEIARLRPFEALPQEMVHFFDEYVHDSRAAFKLSGADNPADAVKELQEWSRALATGKSLYSNRMYEAGMHSWSGPPDFGMKTNERIAAEAFNEARKASPTETDLTKLIPRYINEGREPSAFAEAGYFRFRKIYGGSDDVLLAHQAPDSKGSGRAYAHQDDTKSRDKAAVSSRQIG
jgi:hypothetical protein